MGPRKEWRLYDKSQILLMLADIFILFLRLMKNTKTPHGSTYCTLIAEFYESTVHRLIFVIKEICWRIHVWEPLLRKPGMYTPLLRFSKSIEGWLTFLTHKIWPNLLFKDLNQSDSFSWPAVLALAIQLTWWGLRICWRSWWIRLFFLANHTTPIPEVQCDSHATITESAATGLVSVAVYLYLFDGHAAVFHCGGFILQWEGWCDRVVFGEWWCLTAAG